MGVGKGDEVVVSGHTFIATWLAVSAAGATPVAADVDERTGNLDPETADQVFSMLMKAVRERGVAALVATHNMALVKNFDRTLRLENGALK